MKFKKYIFFIFLQISLLILNLRSQADFDFHQIILFSTGIILTLLWLCMGMLIVRRFLFD
jgi:hypothetical protein